MLKRDLGQKIYDGFYLVNNSFIGDINKGYKYLGYLVMNKSETSNSFEYTWDTNDLGKIHDITNIDELDDIVIINFYRTYLNKKFCISIIVINKHTKAWCCIDCDTWREMIFDCDLREIVRKHITGLKVNFNALFRNISKASRLYLLGKLYGFDRGKDGTLYLKEDNYVLREYDKVVAINIDDFSVNIKDDGIITVKLEDKLLDMRLDALKRGYIIDKYIIDDYDYNQIGLICEGIGLGLDISLYDKKEYNWTKMEMLVKYLSDGILDVGVIDRDLLMLIAKQDNEKIYELCECIYLGINLWELRLDLDSCSIYDIRKARRLLVK